MADVNDNYPPTGNMHPVLAELRDAVTTPVAKQYMEQASVIVNDYRHRQQLADANRAAGDNFMNDLGAIRNNLVGMVREDPTSTPLALDLVRPTMGAILSTVPGHPPELLEDHHNQLSIEMEQDIARTAVHSMAGIDATKAYDLLGRVSSKIPEGEHDALRGYIGTQDKARRIDADAQQKMFVQEQNKAHDNRVWNYAGAMVDAQSGGVKFPPRWAQTVLADPSVTPMASAKLIDTYGRLQMKGDAKASNPFVVRDIVSRLAKR